MDAFEKLTGRRAFREFMRGHVRILEAGRIVLYAAYPYLTIHSEWPPGTPLGVPRSVLPIQTRLCHREANIRNPNRLLLTLLRRFPELRSFLWPNSSASS